MLFRYELKDSRPFGKCNPNGTMINQRTVTIKKFIVRKTDINRTVLMLSPKIRTIVMKGTNKKIIYKIIRINIERKVRCSNPFFWSFKHATPLNVD